MSATPQDLLTRAYVGGVTVTNCMKHMGLSLLERPQDCRLCRSDVSNALSRAIRVNEWLNVWKDDATPFIEQAAADRSSEAESPDGEQVA